MKKILEFIKGLNNEFLIYLLKDLKKAFLRGFPIILGVILGIVLLIAISLFIGFLMIDYTILGIIFLIIIFSIIIGMIE